MRISLCIVIGVLVSTSVYADTLIDIPSVVGKNKNEVSKLIGNPISCGSSKYGEKCQFKKADTEIVFINGKADWITVEGLDNVSFNNEALSKLGLNPSSPTFTNSFTKRWEPHQGLLSVSLFKGGSNSDYAYIKVYTK